MKSPSRISNLKTRLDKILVENGLAGSRERARALIMAGRVLVDRTPIDKPGSLVSKEASVVLKGEDIPFVSRGGLKLQEALNAYKIDVNGLDCLDVGASTGGFTDCLLQRGASRVFAVDVGYGQLAWSLRNDLRVVTIERTNIRYMPKEALSGPVDFATIDVSFISLRIVVPAIIKFLKNNARIAALIKPQFEVGKGKVGKGGVVRDPVLHQSVIDSLCAFFSETGFTHEPVIPSPILGPKGNKEFFVLLQFND